MSDSWDAFVASLRDECKAFRELNTRAIALSVALVENDLSKINAARASLDEQRQAHAQTFSRRRGMQSRGFGNRTLRDVCSFAPPTIAREVSRRASELMYYGISLEIVNNNNKSLIVAGVERLLGVMQLMQRQQSDTPLTYKRRGIVPPLQSSVIMSKKA